MNTEKKFIFHKDIIALNKIMLSTVKLKLPKINQSH